MGMHYYTSVAYVGGEVRVRDDAHLTRSGSAAAAPIDVALGTLRAPDAVLLEAGPGHLEANVALAHCEAVNDLAIPKPRNLMNQQL